MKKNTVRGLLLAMFLGAALNATAQTPEQRDKIVSHYDLEKSRKLIAELKEKAEAERAEALRLAELNGWPVTIREADGTFKQLKKVKNGRPVYLTTYNAQSAVTSRIDKIHTGGGAGLELDGQDMKIGIWDGGAVLSTHQDLAGRVIQEDGATAVSDHATHVAGTMVGSGAGNANAMGMAPEAVLLAHDWVSDTSEMLQRVIEDGLLVSNHSYGIDSDVFDVWEFGAYLQESRTWDDITYDHPYYQPVVAAGNDRDQYEEYNPAKTGKDLLTEQAVSKNVVVVAAIPPVFSFDNLAVETTDFSSWGPTDDRRIKPDIAAKGIGVESTYVPNNNSYASLPGTSMASPGIAGGLLLLQQYYEQIHGEFMLSATLRGLLVHTADDAHAPVGPDYKTGWGLMDAKDATDVIFNANGTDDATAIIDELNLEEGSTYNLTVTANGTEPVKVTISWTDPPGPVYNGANGADNGPDAIVNNLDVRLTSSNTGTVYMPWRLNTGLVTSAPQQADNNVDNVERIDMPLVEGEAPIPAPGEQFVITVTGDFGTGHNDQDFTLIVTGVDGPGVVGGVDDVAMNSIQMWPNPANDVLNFSFGDLSGDDVSVAIYDIQGRQVAAKASFEGAAESIDISSLSAGIYMVEFTSGNAKSSKKLIKK